MIRRVIRIDEEACTGCGACAAACHEGAIRMTGGKARLTREDFCDGLGDCLPACPAGAIAFEEREAPAYDEAAVRSARAESAARDCPGPSRQWPVQLRLVPANAPWLDGADLLIAADCAAYACPDFHSAFARDRAILIGCPKLDGVDYGEKLAEILAGSQVRSVAVVRMEVPCCGGLTQAVKRAVQAAGKDLPWSVTILSTDGKIRS